MAASGRLEEPLLQGSDTLYVERGPNLHVPDSRPSRREGAAGAPAAPPLLSSAGLMSSLAFSWVSPLLHRGSTQQQLQQEDLFQLPHHLVPAVCGRRLWARWHDVSNQGAWAIEGMGMGSRSQQCRQSEVCPNSLLNKSKSVHSYTLSCDPCCVCCAGAGPRRASASWRQA